MTRFVGRIATPVLTDITITWDNLQVEKLEPETLPDLFAGQPLVLLGRYRQPGRGAVVIEGRRSGRRERLRREVVLPERAADNEALARLWARARIHQLDRLLHDADPQGVRDRIAALGLRYHLMTAYTSLVAVDSEISNTTGGSAPVRVPVEMPAGVSYEGVLGISAGQPLPSAASLPSTTGFRESLRSLGYSGAAIATDSSVPRRRVARLRKTAPPPPFTSLTIVRRDGTQIVVQDDGEVWTLGPRGRALRRRLSVAELDALRAVLAWARPDTWSEKGSGERLVVVIQGKQSVVDLPSGAAAVNGLLGMVERWAS